MSTFEEILQYYENLKFYHKILQLWSFQLIHCYANKGKKKSIELIDLKFKNYFKKIGLKKNSYFPSQFVIIKIKKKKTL